MTNDFETFGAHIRNILGPYANIIAMLENISKPDATETEKQVLLKYLLSDSLLKNAKENLEHFKKFSYLEELESINWRATELYKEYSK